MGTGCFSPGRRSDLKFAICDNNTAESRELIDLIAHSFPGQSFKFSLFGDAESLSEAVRDEGCRPDAALIDLDLPPCGGISLAAGLNLSCPGCRIIFISSDINSALEVYEVRHSYFILKSQLHQRIVPAVSRVFSELRSGSYIVFHVNGIACSVASEKVLYLERRLKKTLIFLLGGECLYTSEKPAALLDASEGLNFIHCHQSYYVNPDYIDYLGKDSFILKDGSCIPISRSRHTQVQGAFFSALGRQSR